MNAPPKWEVISLNDVIQDLRSGLSRKLSMTDIGLPVIRSNNITEQGVDFSGIKYWYRNDPQGANTETYFLQDGDLLVNFINSIAQIGKTALYKNLINRDVIYTTNLLRVVASERIIPSFLLLITKTERYHHYIEAITKPAVNQASFTTADFRNFTFLLPPLPEQRRIAAILGTWDNAITLTEQLIAAKQKLKKGLMQVLLTGKRRFGDSEQDWEELTVLQIGGNAKDTVQTGPFGAQLHSSDYVEKGVPLILIRNIIENRLDTSDIPKITPADAARLSRYALEKNDIVFSRVGRVGSCFMATKEHTGWIISGQTLRIRLPKDRLNFRYLSFALQSEKSQRYITGVSIGSTRKSISTSVLEKLPILLPSRDEQEKIATVLQACDAELDLLTRKLAALRQQKKGLMQQLLTGQVRVEGMA